MSSYQIKAWYDKKVISYGDAIRKLISIGFTKAEAIKVLHL